MIKALRLPALLGVLLLALLAGGCAGISEAPVIDKSPGRVIPESWTVRRGDSLYAIAWATGLDYRKIAAWNGLRNPDMIRIGKTLRLRPPAGGAAVAKARPRPAAEPPRKKPTPAKKSPSRESTQLPAEVARWAWPAKGRIIAGYDPKRGVNGIEIGGKPGSEVWAAADGEVVYAGEGLRGYGKLIILKHSAEFLSAYAHNREIDVREGERVRLGQVIGRMGSSGTDKVKLHFEIRRKGEPVNPGRYLPNRA